MTDEEGEKEEKKNVERKKEKGEGGGKDTMIRELYIFIV